MTPNNPSLAADEVERLIEQLIARCEIALQVPMSGVGVTRRDVDALFHAIKVLRQDLLAPYPLEDGVQMDWTSRDGARAVVAYLKNIGAKLP